MRKKIYIERAREKEREMKVDTYHSPFQNVENYKHTKTRHVINGTARQFQCNKYQKTYTY